MLKHLKKYMILAGMAMSQFYGCETPASIRLSMRDWQSVEDEKD